MEHIPVDYLDVKLWNFGDLMNLWATGGEFLQRCWSYLLDHTSKISLRSIILINHVKNITFPPTSS